MYRNDKVTIDLINSLTAKLKTVENKIDDLYKQIFLDYADWYLELKEKEMSVNKRLDNISKRRNFIKTRLLGTGTATKEMLEGTVNYIKGIKVNISLEDMSVIVTFLEAKNNKLINFVKDTLSEIIPYHLDMIISYEHIKWSEPKTVTWNEIKKYTWGDIAESVSGTIENGEDV